MTPDELHNMRRVSGLTQGGLASAIGVSRQTIFTWEAGRQPIPAYRVPLLIHACETAEPKAKRNIPARKEEREALGTLAAYRKMREAPNNFSHGDIIAMWTKHGFTASSRAQQLICEAYPELLAT